MAGDWIKFEHVTPDKPEVDQMAEELGVDPDTVVGKLTRFWVWADQQAICGNALSVTKNHIDRITHQKGFADALLKVGWLQARTGSFAIPHFDRHNGQTAKSRALTKKRVDKSRGTNCNGDSVTKALPEKRREDISLEREPDELLTVEQAKAQALNAGVPEDFSAYVFEDWHSRGGKDAGGVQCQFSRYAKKRWTREQIEWDAKTHKGTKPNGKHSSNSSTSRIGATHDPKGDAASGY